MNKVYILFNDDLVNTAFEEILVGVVSNEAIAKKFVATGESSKPDEIFGYATIKIDDPELLNRIVKEGRKIRCK